MAKKTLPLVNWTVQPIATAPHDGSEVRVLVPGQPEPVLACWNSRAQGWMPAVYEPAIRFAGSRFERKLVQPQRVLHGIAHWVP